MCGEVAATVGGAAPRGRPAMLFLSTAVGNSIFAGRAAAGLVEAVDVAVVAALAVGTAERLLWSIPPVSPVAGDKPKPRVLLAEVEGAGTPCGNPSRGNECCVRSI